MPERHPDGTPSNPSADPSRGHGAELALAILLEGLVEDARVLWLGDVDSGAPDRLASAARSVLALAPNPPPKDETRGRAARISALRSGPLSFREGSFDVIVVPDAGAVDLDDPDRLDDVADALTDDGILVLGSAPEDLGGMGYEALYEEMADRFDQVRMVGQAPFVGWSVVDFEGIDGDYDVTLDGSLAEGESVPIRFYAIASDEENELDAYLVVQVPAASAAMPVVEARAEARPEPKEEPEEEGDDPRLAELEEALQASRDALDRTNDHAEELERTLAARSTDLDRLKDTLREREETLRAMERAARESAGEDPEYARLEAALVDRAAALRELEQEVERRGVLVRDLVEELREAREGGGAGGGGPGGPGSGAAGSGAAGSGGGSVAPVGGGSDATPGGTPDHVLVERALAAEAACAEARFRADELLARLDQRDTRAEEALERQAAELSGTVRGLRSRVAEVAEMRALAEGRLQLVQLDLEGCRNRNRDLQREMAELREQFELELVRARGAAGTPTPPGDPDEEVAMLRASEQRLSKRVGELSGQLMASRDLQEQLREERDLARAEVERLTLQTGSVAPPEGGAKLDAGSDAGSDGRADGGSSGALDDCRAALDEAYADLETRQTELDEARDQADRLRVEVERLKQLETELTVRASDAEERAEREASRAADLASSSAARDALVTRLQMDLAEEERVSQSAAQQVARAREETERLRGALLDASNHVDEALAADDRIGELERALAESRETLDQTRSTLNQLLGTVGKEEAARIAEITALGMDAPVEAARGNGAGNGAGNDGASAPDESELRAAKERTEELERRLGDQDTLMRSLTAQLEERDDRLRALERRLANEGVATGDEEALRRELMELEERAARLSDELLHERKARRLAEQNARRQGGGDQELRRLHERLGESDAELLLVRGQASSSEQNLKAVRNACAQARTDLEELLGSATANGDPGMAERIGTVLRLLSRF